MHKDVFLLPAYRMYAPQFIAIFHIFLLFLSWWSRYFLQVDLYGLIKSSFFDRAASGVTVVEIDWSGMCLSVEDSYPICNARFSMKHVYYYSQPTQDFLNYMHAECQVVCNWIWRWIITHFAEINQEKVFLLSQMDCIKVGLEKWYWY